MFSIVPNVEHSTSIQQHVKTTQAISFVWNEHVVNSFGYSWDINQMINLRWKFKCPYFSTFISKHFILHLFYLSEVWVKIINHMCNDVLYHTLPTLDKPIKKYELFVNKLNTLEKFSHWSSYFQKFGFCCKRRSKFWYHVCIVDSGTNVSVGFGIICDWVTAKLLTKLKKFSSIFWPNCE